MATHADDDDGAISPDAATPLRTLLPREVALTIFARLPVDARARCAAVRLGCASCFVTQHPWMMNEDELRARRDADER
jgi:hypothetical protein